MSCCEAAAVLHIAREKKIEAGSALVASRQLDSVYYRIGTTHTRFSLLLW